MSNSGGIGQVEDLTREAKAVALLMDHPDWTDKRIAETISVNRTTLYRWERFKTARAALKSSRNNLPRGAKDGETGQIEAWEDDDR